VIQLNSELARLTSEREYLGQRLTEQKKEVEDIQGRFTTEFQNLANTILEEKSKKFTEQNREQLSILLDPLKTNIKEFEKKVSDVYMKESNERATLAEQIRGLSELNKRMTDEANNLTSALKGQSKTQGDWGEVVLEEILEKSGLMKGTHYETQQSFADEQGKTLRPDIVVHLPEHRHLVIDSKVSLTAYTEYCRTDDPDMQARYLKEHLESIRKHIKSLGEKSYQSIYQLHSLDFVLMFVPLEPAYMLAAKNDSAVWNDAFEKNIVIVTSSTLLGLMRTISSIWRRESQNRNAMEIARKSGELFDKFVALVEDLQAVGKKIHEAADAHEEAVRKLSSGRGNLVKRVQDIKALGAKASKSLPQTLLESSDDTSEPEEGNDDIR
jgi:DNA recombination protein RmuC